MHPQPASGLQSHRSCQPALPAAAAPRGRQLLASPAMAQLTWPNILLLHSPLLPPLKVGPLAPLSADRETPDCWGVADSQGPKPAARSPTMTRAVASSGSCRGPGHRSPTMTPSWGFRRQLSRPRSHLPDSSVKVREQWSPIGNRYWACIESGMTSACPVQSEVLGTCWYRVWMWGTCPEPLPITDQHVSEEGVRSSGEPCFIVPLSAPRDPPLLA